MTEVFLVEVRLYYIDQVRKMVTQSFVKFKHVGNEAQHLACLVSL